jgi:preprotein translocase subunit SecG
MQYLLSAVHILVGLFLILVVLLQTGRAGGMGASFGGGSGGVFGARGANPFLSKLTAASAIIFFLTSMSLSIMSSRTGSVVADQAGAAETTPPADTTVTPPVPGADTTPTPENKPAENKPVDPTKPGATPAE